MHRVQSGKLTGRLLATHHTPAPTRPNTSASCPRASRAIRRASTIASMTTSRDLHLLTPSPACNQACLDHSFQAKTASCLVNPRAAYESELHIDVPTTAPMNLAVVGAGPAGLAFALTAANRGHRVTLYDGAEKIGGQFNLAKQVGSNYASPFPHAFAISLCPVSPVPHPTLLPLISAYPSPYLASPNLGGAGARQGGVL